MLRTIIYIPQWIAENVQRNKENLSVVLDLQRLSKFTSVDDLASFVALNDAIGGLLGLDINLNIGAGISQYWMQCADTATKAFFTNTVAPNITPNMAHDAFVRLMGAKSIFEEDYSDTFDAIDLGANASAILLKYGFFDVIEPRQMKFKLIEAVLQILYVYYPHHEIAGSAIGRTYLELLT